MPAKPIRESKRSSADERGALSIFTELGYFALAEDLVPFSLTERPNKSVSITLSFPQHLDMYIAPFQRNSFMGFVCGSSEDIAFSI